MEVNISLTRLKYVGRLVEWTVLLTAILGMVGFLYFESLNAQPRPHCADLVMTALGSDEIVKGTFDCLSSHMQYSVVLKHVYDDESFAKVFGGRGTWVYWGRTQDQGYIYELKQGRDSTIFTLYLDNDGRVGGVQ